MGNRLAEMKAMKRGAELRRRSAFLGMICERIVAARSAGGQCSNNDPRIFSLIVDLTRKTENLSEDELKGLAALDGNGAEAALRALQMLD